MSMLHHTQGCTILGNVTNGHVPPILSLMPYHSDREFPSSPLISIINRTINETSSPMQWVRIACMTCTGLSPKLKSLNYFLCVICTVRVKVARLNHVNHHGSTTCNAQRGMHRCTLCILLRHGALQYGTRKAPQKAKPSLFLFSVSSSSIKNSNLNGSKSTIVSQNKV